MKPVRVQIDVPQAREDVYDYLDVMANHEPFTNHMMVNWRYAGPPRGVGSKAQVEVKLGGRTEQVEIETVSAQAPERIVEQNVGAGGKRVANGTYILEELPSGGTRIIFEYSWQQAPTSERLAAPLVRAMLRRGNERAMERLAQLLARPGSTTAASPSQAA
jgi:Polyketide cyclase / dehydrase and lipid transport